MEEQSPASGRGVGDVMTQSSLELSSSSTTGGSSGGAAAASELTTGAGSVDSVAGFAVESSAFSPTEGVDSGWASML